MDAIACLHCGALIASPRSSANPARAQKFCSARCRANHSRKTNDPWAVIREIRAALARLPRQDK